MITFTITRSYAEGVNAWLDDHKGSAASLEYAILALLSPSYKIQSWTPVNSLTVIDVLEERDGNS